MASESLHRDIELFLKQEAMSIKSRQKPKSSPESATISYTAIFQDMTLRISRKQDGYLVQIPLEESFFVPQSFIDSTIELLGPGERFSIVLEDYSDSTSDLERVVTGTEFPIIQDKGANFIDTTIPELDAKAIQFLLMGGLTIDTQGFDEDNVYGNDASQDSDIPQGSDVSQDGLGFDHSTETQDQGSNWTQDWDRVDTTDGWGNGGNIGGGDWGAVGNSGSLEDNNGSRETAAINNADNWKQGAWGSTHERSHRNDKEAEEVADSQLEVTSKYSDNDGSNEADKADDQQEGNDNKATIADGEENDEVNVAIAESGDISEELVQSDSCPETKCVEV